MDIETLREGSTGVIVDLLSQWLEKHLAERDGYRSLSIGGPIGVTNWAFTGFMVNSRRLYLTYLSEINIKTLREWPIGGQILRHQTGAVIVYSA